MPEGTTLEEQVSELLAQTLIVEDLAPDTDLVNARLLDSLGFATLVVSLEQVFGIETALEDLEIDNFRSVARIAQYVRRRLNGDRPS